VQRKDVWECVKMPFFPPSGCERKMILFFQQESVFKTSDNYWFVLKMRHMTTGSSEKSPQSPLSRYPIEQIWRFWKFWKVAVKFKNKFSLIKDEFSLKKLWKKKEAFFHNLKKQEHNFLSMIFPILLHKFYRSIPATFFSL
jgi:hypothetical protein